jgi:2-hydroxy-3-keto-5-methylthiopentenyl-1-phosphate phosphatase
MKKIVQLDFDGTVTLEDVSYFLLDKYAGDLWRSYLDEYSAGRINVGTFSKKVFGMFKDDRRTMTEAVLTSDRTKIRPGFREMLGYLSSRNVKVVIVSHGLEFYIDALLKTQGLSNIEVHAAENEFSPQGMKIRYSGPDGRELDTGFKEAYTRFLMKSGYDVIYIGDGTSDIDSCRLVYHVFATGALVELGRDEKLAFTPFDDFHDVIRGLEDLKHK